MNEITYKWSKKALKNLSETDEKPIKVKIEYIEVMSDGSMIIYIEPIGKTK